MGEFAPNVVPPGGYGHKMLSKVLNKSTISVRTATANAVQQIFSVIGVGCIWAIMFNAFCSGQRWPVSEGLTIPIQVYLAQGGQVKKHRYIKFGILP